MNTLIIICGLSFAGKSTLGNAIAAHLGHEQVDVDRTKERLYGRDVNDEHITREQWDTIYADTDALTVHYLDSGKNVVDASRNFTRTERDHIRGIVTDRGHRSITVHVNTPESIARQRWKANREHPLRRDVTDTDFEEIVRVWEPPLDDERPVVFGFDETIEAWIAEHIDILT